MLFRRFQVYSLLKLFTNRNSYKVFANVNDFSRSFMVKIGNKKKFDIKSNKDFV